VGSTNRPCSREPRPAQSGGAAGLGELVDGAPARRCSPLVGEQAAVSAAPPISARKLRRPTPAPWAPQRTGLAMRMTVESADPERSPVRGVSAGTRAARFGDQPGRSFRRWSRSRHRSHSLDRTLPWFQSGGPSVSPAGSPSGGPPHVPGPAWDGPGLTVSLAGALRPGAGEVHLDPAAPTHCAAGRYSPVVYPAVSPPFPSRPDHTGRPISCSTTAAASRRVARADRRLCRWQPAKTHDRFSASADYGLFTIGGVAAV
jgi:hypothetical protein